MDTSPIVVPARPSDPRRPPIRVLAAVVPLAGGILMWLFSGSVIALCVAALGPLMLVASVLDGARSRRRERRSAEIEHDQAWRDAEGELARRQDHERARRRSRHPDAATCLTEPPLRSGERVDAATLLVVGAGTRPSGIRATGGGADVRARDFQERCGVLDGAPVTIPLGGGVCVRGATPISAAVVRALVVQLCLRFGAGQLALTGDGVEAYGLAGLPHARAAGRGAFRIALTDEGHPTGDADALIRLVGPGGEVPEGITTVLDVVEPRRAELRTPDGVDVVSVEALSREQAQAAGATLADGAVPVCAVPASVALSELAQRASSTGLPATIGRGAAGDLEVDIVEDGPHAIVTGMTGSGKSELLVSWVAAIAAQHPPSRVAFVLADFKGGTAFEALSALPQVAAVITDLDEAGARRGVSSLTAELRRREGVLAAAGARDIADVDMPRLVIVVDEFAALLQEYPDLGAVFTDIAARGRALGMHLVLGTQRASGVIRDALAANCPLRVSLRVGDAADSRLVVGAPDAAELPGGPAGRGLAIVRRPRDAEPVMVRIALTAAPDLPGIAGGWTGEGPARSPWLPALPSLLRLEEMRTPTRGGEEARGTDLANGGDAVSGGDVVIGRADLPGRQEQPLELLRIGADRGLAVLGAPGTGRTAVLRAIASQVPGALHVPEDPEGAWDVVTGLADGRRECPPLVLCDEIDAQVGELPAEYGQHLVQAWERLLRGAPRTTFVLTATRAAGAVGRLLDALPRRALLRMPSRVEHLAAGGESRGYDRERPAGRATIGDHEVQFGWVPEYEGRTPRPSETPQWTPAAGVTAIVTPGPHSVARRLAEAFPGCSVALAPNAPDEPTRPVLLVADAETWQRNWSLWQHARAEGEVLIRAENPGDLRQLAGIRDLPPYARPHAGRAWVLGGVEPPRRVALTALETR